MEPSCLVRNHRIPIALRTLLEQSVPDQRASDGLTTPCFVSAGVIEISPQQIKDDVSPVALEAMQEFHDKASHCQALAAPQ